MKKLKSIHTSRTMMFAELSKVMDHAIQDDAYLDSLNQNIANKKTKSNQNYTTSYLKKIYHFDPAYPAFKCLKHFWQISSEKDKPVLTLLYAIAHDFLLAESYAVINAAKPGDRITIKSLEENITSIHPDRYSENTTKSIAQNIASSWKQAGSITGKVKNIRTQPAISFYSLAFAFLMAYLNGNQGDFIITSKWVKALCLGDLQVRELAVEASKANLLQYQYAGSVTSISFTSLFNKLGLNGI